MSHSATLAFSIWHLAFLQSFGILHSQVPNLVSYQGRVAVGTVNFDGTGQFKFALVNTNGSTTYWSNSPDTSPADGVPDNAVTLTVTKGLYSVLLGDTIGEMGLYLRLTEIAFVGRSLTAEGGQNPLEPAMLNTAVLAGLNVQNFRESYQRLIDKGGAKLVRDRDMLAGAVNFLLKNPNVRRNMITAAASAVEEMRGALDRTYRVLDPFIQPLMVKSRLRHGGGQGAG